MGLVLAAVGAAVAALLEFTIASRIQVAGVQLQILLVFGILLTLVSGFEHGMAWAFVGGLFADLLGMRPLGSTVFALLVVVGSASLLGRLLLNIRPFDTVVSVLVLTPIYLVVVDMSTMLLRPPAPAVRLTDLAAAALVNTLLAALVAALVYLAKRRSEQREKRSVW